MTNLVFPITLFVIVGIGQIAFALRALLLVTARLSVSQVAAADAVKEDP